MQYVIMSSDCPILVRQLIEMAGETVSGKTRRAKFSRMVKAFQAALGIKAPIESISLRLDGTSVNVCIETTSTSHVTTVEDAKFVETSN